MPANNGAMPEYGFNVPGQAPPAQYGFNPQISNYPLNDTQGGEFAGPQFATQLLAQPVVANMAAQYGNALVGTGKQHLEKYVPVTALKYYFAVNTDYVFAKLMLLFFPFTHKVSFLGYFWRRKKYCVVEKLCFNSFIIIFCLIKYIFT